MGPVFIPGARIGAPDPPAGGSASQAVRVTWRGEEAGRRGCVPGQVRGDAAGAGGAPGQFTGAGDGGPRLPGAGQGGCGWGAQGRWPGTMLLVVSTRNVVLCCFRF